MSELQESVGSTNPLELWEKVAFLNGRLDAQSMQIAGLQAENTGLRAELRHLHDDLGALRQCVKSLAGRVDELETAAPVLAWDEANPDADL